MQQRTVRPLQKKDMDTAIGKDRQLNNKKVIVLGGSSGLGLATAQAAAIAGAQVIIVSGNEKRMREALATLPANAEGYSADLGRNENVQHFFSEVGTFDHLVYTAGDQLTMSELAEMDLEQAKHFFTIRYWGALAAIKYGSANISPKGSINLISGIASSRPGKGWALAASVCGAIEGLTRAMAVELAPIRVNCVLPGVIKTNLWNTFSEEQRNGFYATVGNSLLVKRVGEAEDIAQAFIYLMQQSFCTGQCLIVDGGAQLV